MTFFKIKCQICICWIIGCWNDYSIRFGPIYPSIVKIVALHKYNKYNFISHMNKIIDYTDQ